MCFQARFERVESRSGADRVIKFVPEVGCMYRKSTETEVFLIPSRLDQSHLLGRLSEPQWNLHLQETAEIERSKTVQNFISEN